MIDGGLKQAGLESSVGGAAMFSTSLALIAIAFTGRERGMALGIWGATVGGAVAIGPLVGGLLTDSAGWEWIFFVNLPIGAAAIAVTLRTVSESRAPGARGIDLPGLVTFSASLFLLVFALVRGNPEGWGSGLIVALLGRIRGPARGVRGDRAAQQGPDARPVAVP